ncbi:glycine-rich domain-containing protein [Bdellovibrio sp. HCB2-146]|uniref:glycine-rich domain-containing protein n=1 Tax=Bdellovibrio sp. HCB2-146 TaxID=3394362 RepID=UPI0039BD8F23
MRLLFLVSLILITSSVSLAHVCSGGSCGTRGGGDFLEWSFYDVAKAVVPVLAKSSDKLVQAQTQEMSRVLSCLRVQISEKPFLDLQNRSVIAINDPELCLVILSRPGWEKIQDNESRVRLVVHELVSLALMNDFQYEVSLALSHEYFRLYQLQESLSANRFKIFRSSGVFKVPKDVNRVRVTAVGAGGGGGGGHLARGLGAGGGGGGAVRTREVIVKGTDEVVITVGRGGAGASGGGYNGSKGESSSFGSLLFAEGGGGGYSGYYNTSMGYGGIGGGSGGGGGGSGVNGVCSGAGGVAGSPGKNGFVSRNGGAGGAGSAWDSLDEFIKLNKFSAGPGGRCVGSNTVYNGGGGGGGIQLGEIFIKAEDGRGSDDRYSGLGGSGGEGFGAGGGGGTGAEGVGGAGAPGVVYLEYYSSLSE